MSLFEKNTKRDCTRVLIQIKGGARERRMPSARCSRLWQPSRRRAYSKWMLMTSTTASAGSTGVWRIWQSTQLSTQSCPDVRWPACGMWFVHSTHATSLLACDGWTCRDAMNSIGRNTANIKRDAILRFCVTFTAAKLRISERNAKQKTLFLILFPNGSIFATLVAKLK